MSCWGGDWWIFFGLSCFEERVKEASSSEVPQKKGLVRTYSDSLERPRSVPMQPYLGSMVLCLINTCVVGFKVLRDFYANYGESVQPLQS